MKTTDTRGREETLHHGKCAIVAVLCDLPQTQHDPLSFAVDLLHYTVSVQKSIGSFWWCLK